ncbi:MAG TPA: hypothetical protein DEQ48_03070, partial [Helicobacter sp.]|nr:hypothetical protein [Helicobacter sp.]
LSITPVLEDQYPLLISLGTKLTQTGRQAGICRFFIDKCKINMKHFYQANAIWGCDSQKARYF